VDIDALGDIRYCQWYVRPHDVFEDTQAAVESLGCGTSRGHTVPSGIGLVAPIAAD
jgi:hypothetical protein